MTEFLSNRTIVASSSAPARSSGRRDYVPLIGRTLIVASLPAVFLWWHPLFEFPGLGRVTISDLVLMALWPLSLLRGFSRFPADVQLRRPVRILALSLSIGLLSTFGTLSFVALGGEPGTHGNAQPLLEFGHFLKRFGLASILPFAITTFAGRELRVGIFWSVAASFVVMLAFGIWPQMMLRLPIADAHQTVADDYLRSTELSGVHDRRIGLLSNPNDWAYLSVVCLAIFCALTPAGRLAAAAQVLGLAMSLGSVGLSASRSGALGLCAGVLYYSLARRRGRRGQRAASFAAVVIISVVAVAASGSLRERFSMAYDERLEEANVSSRLEAQSIALKAWLLHPFGVGYLNFYPVTARLCHGSEFDAVLGSDNVYCDTLLGSGILGFGALAMLLVTCWQHIAGDGRRGGCERVVFLHAGCAAVIVFGFAAVSPISVFVSPFFFCMVGARPLAPRERE